MGQSIGNRDGQGPSLQSNEPLFFKGGLERDCHGVGGRSGTLCRWYIFAETDSKLNASDQASDKSLPQVNFHLISFEGETGIPDLWPLAKLRPRIESSPAPSGGLFKFRVFFTCVTPLQAEERDADVQDSQPDSNDEEQQMVVDGPSTSTVQDHAAGSGK